MNPKRKTILAVSIVIVVIALSLIAVFSENRVHTSAEVKLARVACLGDSITQITGYPTDLQTLLGNSSIVGNFGVSGAAVNFNSNKPYVCALDAFKSAESFEPTAVIIMLGTNDAQTEIYQQINSFIADYESLISAVQAWNSKPQIFLVEPPPIFNNALDLNGTGFAQGIIPRIQQVAKAMNLPLINVYTPLLNYPEYFTDGVHPNSAGAQVIANIIYKAIKSDST